jgi:protease-4
MPGVQIGLMFWAGLFEKLHIQADMVQVGKFKGAAEPYTRTEASPEFKKEIETLIDGMYGHLVTLVSDNRKLTADEVKAAIDEGWITGKKAKQMGLVDKLMNRDKINDWLTASFENGADLITDYGQPKSKAIDLSSPFGLLSMLSSDKPTTKTNQPAIAVIYADGEISPDSNSATSDDQVTPGRMRKALDMALEDKLVKAIVLRIDSPGGSASASDEIWQMLKEADKKKPVTVSMGRLAASGGYYIACAGRDITAEKSTITGSIGVVGGKIVLKGLADMAGINIQTISKGKHAGIFDAMRPFTDEEKTFVTALMGETYDLFKSRVLDGRGDKIKNIDDVAQGRLFTGDHALEVGLVDRVGSLDDTIIAAANGAGVEKSYQILTFPEAKTLSDLLRDGLSGDAALPAGVEAGLAAVPAAYRREAVKTLHLMETLREQKVMVAFPAGLLLDGK